MLELEERNNHLKYIEDIISHIKKNKDIIQNIVVLWDFKDSDNSIDIDFSFLGNGNAALGMIVKAQDVIINKKFKNGDGAIESRTP